MKKKRLLSLLLSAAIAAGTLPAMLATGAQAAEAEASVNLLEGRTPGNSVLISGGNKYARVTEITQKNNGVNMTFEDLIEGVYSLSYRIRPIIQDATGVNSTKDNGDGTFTYDFYHTNVTDGDRGFRVYLNEIESFGSIAYSNGRWNGSGKDFGYKFAGASTVKAYTYSVEIPAETDEEGNTLEGSEPTTEDVTAPYMITTFEAADDELWINVKTTFRVTTEGNTDYKTNESLTGLAPGTLTVRLSGGNSNSLRDIAPFDIDDVCLVKVNADTVPDNDDDNLALDGNVIKSYDFENGENDVLKPVGSTVYIADDDTDFYRITGMISSIPVASPTVLTPGVYTFSGDFRLAGYNSDMIKTEDEYKAEAEALNADDDNDNDTTWNKLEYADIVKSHNENWREFSIQLMGLNGKANAPYDALGSHTVGASSTQAKGTAKVSGFDPNEWVHHEFTIAINDGKPVAITKINIRGGMTATSVTAKSLELAKYEAIEHRSLAFDVKNLSFVKNPVESSLTTEDMHDDSAFDFTEAEQSIILAEDDALWDGGTVKVLGNASNTYISVFNAVSNQGGIVVDTDSIDLEAGDYAYSFDIRKATNVDENPMLVRTLINQDTLSDHGVYIDSPLSSEWTTFYSWDTKSAKSSFACSAGDLKFQVWGAAGGVVKPWAYIYPFDIDNIVIYKCDATTGVMTEVGSIDFESENYTISSHNNNPGDVVAQTETGNVITVDASAEYAPSNAVTLAPGKYELSGDFRLSEWSLDKCATKRHVEDTTSNDYNYVVIDTANGGDMNAQNIKFGIGLESGNIVDANAEGTSFEVTEVWTPLTYTFTVEEETALTSITLAGSENMPFYADELTLTAVEVAEIPEPEPEAFEITFAAGAGVESVGEGKLYFKNGELWSDKECKVEATEADIPVINVITGEAGTQYREAAWYNGDEPVSDVFTLAPTEALTLTAIAQPYYMVTFAFDEASEGVSIKYGEVTYTKGSFNTDYFKKGSGFPAITHILEDGCEYSWDKNLPKTVESYEVYTIKGVLPVDTNYEIELCTDENLAPAGKQLIFVKSEPALKYDGEAMIYSKLHDAYVAEVDASLDKNAIDALITESDADAPTVNAYDVNDNGAITAGDAAYVNILLHENKVNTLDLAARLACDSNGDKAVTVTDCTQILKKSVGLI